MLKQITLICIIFVQKTIPADQMSSGMERVIEEEKIKTISSIESLCLGNFTFNTSDPNKINIPDYMQSKIKYEMPLHQFKTYVFSAHQKIQTVLPQAHLSLFIQASRLIRETKVAQLPDDNELIRILKDSLDHRLSFAYFQLHLFSTKEHSISTQKKCREILDIITQNKPDAIRYLWREAPGEPNIPANEVPFLNRYTSYCQKSINSLKEKINNNRRLEVEQKRLAQIEAERKVRQDSYCSIS